MWARSYRIADRLHCTFTATQSFVVATNQGRLAVVAYQQGTAPNDWKTGRYRYPVNDDLAFPLGDVRQYDGALGFGVIQQPTYFVPQMTLQMPRTPPGWFN
jgi:hypothetical protein